MYHVLNRTVARLPLLEKDGDFADFGKQDRLCPFFRAASASLNPALLAHSVTFTATVSVNSPGAGTPTGTVTFSDGGTTMGTASLSGGTATFTTSSLTVSFRQACLNHGG